MYADCNFLTYFLVFYILPSIKMENAIMIAKIGAIVYLTIALATFLNPSMMKKLLDDFIKNPGLTFLTAWITLIIGMLVILSYNVWTRHRGLLITIIGRIATIKWILLFIIPHQLMKMSMKLMKYSWTIPLFALILWLLLLFLGFFK